MNKERSGDLRNRVAKILLEKRKYWSTAILVIVGIGTAVLRNQDKEGLDGYYSTAAQVIVTLYVAWAIEIAISGPAGTGSKRLTVEHGIYAVISSAGLVSCIRALGISQEWWLAGLAGAGVVAAVLLLAEAIIDRHAGDDAALWSIFFIIPAILLLTIKW